MDDISTRENIKKSNDCRQQLHFWSRLLDGRIALQKVIVASREWEEENRDSEQELETDTIRTISKLLKTLVSIRNEYRSRSQFCIDRAKEKDLSHNRVDDLYLNQAHENYRELRISLIDKWYEKTKIGCIPKKGYTALELPTTQLISNALKDKEKLIRRTRIDRSSQQDEPQPEIFNDDDFYHHLLKEVVSKEEGSKWVELQRLRYKAKRKADTKATKGRKIKRDLIPKLVNFMAPVHPSDQTYQQMPEQVRDELVKSLFGGGS